jgi:hypothetical protein
VLETIVEHEVINSMPREHLATFESVGPNSDLNLSRKTLSQKSDFIALRQALGAGICAPAISSRQNRRLLPFTSEAFRDPKRHRSFARTADR